MSKIDITCLDDDIIINIPVRFLSGYNSDVIYSQAIENPSTIDLASMVSDTNMKLRTIIDLEPMEYSIPGLRIF